MNLIESLFNGFANKKLGANFEESVMKALEETSCTEEEILSEIVARYKTIIGILSPKHVSVKLNADDWQIITIDNTQYDLADTSIPSRKKFSEHVAAIEHLVCDFEDFKKIAPNIEERLNDKE